MWLCWVYLRGCYLAVLFHRGSWCPHSYAFGAQDFEYVLVILWCAAPPSMFLMIFVCIYILIFIFVWFGFTWGIFQWKLTKDSTSIIQNSYVVRFFFLFIFSFQSCLLILFGKIREKTGLLTILPTLVHHLVLIKQSLGLLHDHLPYRHDIMSAPIITIADAIGYRLITVETTRRSNAF